MAVGGDIIEITYNHPTLGSGTLYPKSGEAFTLDQGGIRSADDANGIDGSGTPIRTMNYVRWTVEGIISWSSNTTNEVDVLSKLAADPVESDWTLASINGVVWGGKGFPVGDINGDTNAATTSIKISGGKLFKKIG